LIQNSSALELLDIIQLATIMQMLSTKTAVCWSRFIVT
jgi:hypothetical protein